MASESKKELSLNEVTKKTLSDVEVLNTIYRVNTKYKNDDGSYMVINIQSIQFHDLYTNNIGKSLSNVIVVENSVNSEQNVTFVKKQGFLRF